jgi:hypothetical protein
MIKMTDNRLQYHGKNVGNTNHHTGMPLAAPSSNYRRATTNRRSRTHKQEDKR